MIIAKMMMNRLNLCYLHLLIVTFLVKFLQIFGKSLLTFLFTIIADDIHSHLDLKVNYTVGFEVRSKEDALRAHEVCRNTFPVPDDVYDLLLDYQLPEHRYTNCYVKCWVETMGLFTPQKGFNEKNIVSQFTHDNTHNLASVRHGLEKCIDHNESESDVCTWAHRVYSCWLKVNRHIVRKMFAN